MFERIALQIFSGERGRSLPPCHSQPFGFTQDRLRRGMERVGRATWTVMPLGWRRESRGGTSQSLIISEVGNNQRCLDFARHDKKIPCTTEPHNHSQLCGYHREPRRRRGTSHNVFDHTIEVMYSTARL